MPKIKAEHIFQLACATIIFGLLASRFLISIGMILFLVAGLWEGNFKQKFKAFYNNKYYLAITGIFILFLISGIWSEDFGYFLNRMRIKLPILFLPFAFCAIPTLSTAVIKRVLWDLYSCYVDFGFLVIGDVYFGRRTLYFHLQ